MQRSALVIITGPSGSGKGTFLRALEDRGYFCVDNLPVEFLTKFADLVAVGERQRAALVVDVREGQTLDQFPDIYRQLKKGFELEVSLFYLEASDDVLIRRYSETRRPHPLDATLPVRDAIEMERERLVTIRQMADHVVDTSPLSIHELRVHAEELLGSGEKASLLVTLVSFGYKYGIPVDADMIFDVRFLPNPHFVSDLRSLTGADQPVVEFMHAEPLTNRCLNRFQSLLDFLLPEFEREGKSYLTIAIGCTGGRHRSVMMANALANLTNAHRQIKVIHRDMEK